jgi:ABC-type nickel/cobalt efflux system permease component RcnA
MDFLGLIFECIFFSIGLYLYLYSRGKVNITTHTSNADAEAFRQKNSRWLRILSLLLMAVMSLEIVLHLRDLIRG